MDAETKESLLKHLDEHGAVSLLASNKFGQFAACILEEIEGDITAESTLITPDADDLAGNRDEMASTADERLDIAIPESHQ